LVRAGRALGTADNGLDRAPRIRGHLGLLDEGDGAGGVVAVHHADAAESAALVLRRHIGPARNRVLRLHGESDDV
jgi:hypothetical protein